jgi:hypothetical protein
MFRKDNATARLRCYLPTLNWEGWLSSQTLTHMLRALSLIYSTLQIELNNHFWDAVFTLEVSLLCALGASAGCEELYSLGTRLLPLVPQVLLLVFPGAASTEVLGKPLNASESRGSSSMSSALAVVELRDFITASWSQCL